MAWDLSATSATKIGFATHQNAVPVIRELSVIAPPDQAGKNLRLILAADPPFLQQKTWRIDAISAGETLRIVDRNIGLNATLLLDLAESLIGRVILTLQDEEGEILAERTEPIELLAHNHWGGLPMGELLPAFAMPNDPAIDRILKMASDILRKAGRPDGIDGYKSNERRRVWELASAVWAAIAGLRLSYALPPASFERSGQKVRTPSQIFEGRLATCLDTTLLFAAALEQANLNPLIVLTQGHAFAGVWLQPVEFATVVTEEAAALRRRIDLDEMVLFETTLVTANPPASFSQAIALARRQIAEDAEAPFQMAIDLRRARLQKIRPLGLSTPGAAPGADAPVAAEGLEAAPALPAFDVEVTEAPTTASGRILQWQRKLLNLTTSNTLLNLRDSKSAVKLLCPDPEALEDLLAAGKRIRIAPMPDLTAGGRDEKLFEQQTQTRLRDELAAQAMQRGEALSLLSKDQLDAALVGLYRKARTDLEEGGANTLYLALGFLKWKKSAAEEKSYRAPLILLPVQLERKSALSGVAMIAHEDEPRFNLTLLELLRQDFELTIPGLDGDLPKDRSGIDVAGIWRLVRTAVRDMAGFEVVPEVVLGTFSFAKYLMWKDLVDRADRLKDSPLVRHLIERDGSVEVDRGAFPRAHEMDRTLDPASLFTPLPADSSQLVAVVASAEGRHFVLDGPPGTGKSQTIANMIAHNLGLGRRVLFVAEKRAALEVVQRRLADKGLAPFCLELHSAKATKSAVLRQLDSAWTARDALSAEDWAREAAEARRLRDELNAVVAVLHRAEPNGWTIHRAIGRAVKDAHAATPRLAFPAAMRHSAEEMTSFRDIARRLGIARKAIADLPADFDGLARTEWSNEWQEAVLLVASSLPEAIIAAEEAAARLSAATGLPLPGPAREAFDRLLALAALCLTLQGQDWRFAFAADMAERVAAARHGLGLIGRYKAEGAALSAVYAPEAVRRIDIEAIRAAWLAAGAKFVLFAGGAKRKVAQALAQAGGVTSMMVDPETDLPRLAAMRDLLAQIDALAPQVQGLPGWAGLDTDPAQIANAVATTERLRAAIAASAETPEALAALRRAVAALVLDANDMLTADGPVAGAAERLRRALERLDADIARFAELASPETGLSLAALRAAAETILRHGSRLRDWTAWRRVRGEALEVGLAALVEALERGAVVADETVRCFDTAYARWFAFTRIDQEPLLRQFMAGEHEDRIDRFRKLDDRMSELSSRYIRAKLCGMIPDKNDVSKKDGYGVLKYQLQLQRPSKPIRQLAAEMGDAFTRLAPCMLMSPLSIAQYLPAEQALFDLVIFDEASQITPWDAIGAMARGKQVVIAGDPKQMPPSNDFTRSSGTETADDDTMPDMPSILDECLAAGVPRHSLDWHYRSRHESLICFSNTRYYESRLVTFPGPETKPSAVSWRRVPGVYTGGARINPIEAQAIVDEAVRRLRDPAFVDERGQPLSLGIITMNAEQMRLVEDLLDKARRAHPAIEEHFDGENRLEPVCVRNLETVQGDERDVILIGVNFGPAEPGGRTMSMAFGKLNASGGWRRLNVATTRARREMMVFTSFDPGMIDLTRTAAEGVRDLKAFIEFADRGPRALAEANRGSLGGADSPFEEAVAAALRQRGWTVVPQVGVSKFRIDLGIVHPDRPGDFLLGVECDGAAYHSAATARDRDKVRAAILEGLGWSLLRIWSTDWWIDKERAAERLHAQIEAALAADREAMAERVALAAMAAVQPAPLLEPEGEPGSLVSDNGEPHNLQPVTADEPVVAVSAPAEAQPVYARLVEPPAVKPAADGLYRVTDLQAFSDKIDPAAFYEPRYDGVLIGLIGAVLATEAPIAETVLVQRIARTHGFDRAGPVIRKRIMAITERLHVVEEEEGGGRFVWTDAAARCGWNQARAPAGPDDLRAIEEIALRELAAYPGHDAVEVARYFGVRRLSASARARIETAYKHGAGEER
jgi:very-short-patch-repair endonuclease